MNNILSRFKAGLFVPAALGLLPLAYFGALLLMQAEATPYWLWMNVDPSYFYLLNGLEVLKLQPPFSIQHPGTTTQMLVALILRLAHPAQSVAAIVGDALDDPEKALILCARVEYALISLAMIWVGREALTTFRRLTAYPWAPVLLVQATPFLSTVILMNAYTVKPEGTLVISELVLAAVILRAVRGGARPLLYAVAFGVLWGFAVITKLHTAPLIFVPLFLLPTGRLRLVYAIVGMTAAVVFFSPALPNVGLLLEWFRAMATHQGPYGQGAQGFLPDNYLFNVLKQFRRPVFSVPLLAGAWVLWRRRGDFALPEIPLAQALAGLCLAQFAMVLVVAKHPISYYLLPALMLSGITAALLFVLLKPLVKLNDMSWARGWLGGLAILALTQAVSIVKQVGGRRLERTTSEAVDMRPFAACAKVYFDFASEPAYALNLGNQIAGYHFAEDLERRWPNDIYVWSLANGLPQRWTKDSVALQAITASRTCTVFRGAWGSSFEAEIHRLMPEADLKTCSNGDESVFTIGMNCAGAFPRR